MRWMMWRAISAGSCFHQAFPLVGPDAFLIVFKSLFQLSCQPIQLYFLRFQLNCPPAARSVVCALSAQLGPPQLYFDPETARVNPSILLNTSKMLKLSWKGNESASGQAGERGCGECVRVHRYTIIMSKQAGEADPACSFTFSSVQGPSRVIFFLLNC